MQRYGLPLGPPDGNAKAQRGTKVPYGRAIKSARVDAGRGGSAMPRQQEVTAHNQNPVRPRQEEERAAVGEGPSAQEEEVVPRRLKLQQRDLEKYGHTAQGCRRCRALINRRSATGLQHSEACLKRIQGEMEKDGDPMQ